MLYYLHAWRFMSAWTAGSLRLRPSNFRFEFIISYLSFTVLCSENFLSVHAVQALSAALLVPSHSTDLLQQLAIKSIAGVSPELCKWLEARKTLAIYVLRLNKAWSS